MVTRQRQRFVDAAIAEDLAASAAVRLLHLLREGRVTRAHFGASQAFPVQRHRADFTSDLVDFVVTVGDREVRAGELSSVERMIVVG